MVRSRANQPCLRMAWFLWGMLVPEKPRGVTYSRPSTGTDMPFKERFRARPARACLEAPSLKSKLSVSWRTAAEATRNQLLCVVAISFVVSERGEFTAVRGRPQVGFSRALQVTGRIGAVGHVDHCSHPCHLADTFTEMVQVSLDWSELSRGVVGRLVLQGVGQWQYHVRQNEVRLCPQPP